MNVQIIFRIEITDANTPGCDELTLRLAYGDLKNAERDRGKDLLKFSPSDLTEDLGVNFVSEIIKDNLSDLMKSAKQGEI